MFNFPVVFNLLSLLIGISGIAMLLSLPFSFYYHDGSHIGILYAGIGSIALGGLGFWLSRRRTKRQELRKRDGYVVVTLGWLVMSLVGALPYVLSGAIPDFTDAFFETMSGFTTTGATI